MTEAISQLEETAFLESFVELVKSPNLLSVGKLSGFLADRDTLQKMVVSLSLNPQGKQAFLDRPSLGKIDFQQLYKLPKHTLGHVYADHILRNGLIPLAAEDMNTDSFNS